MRGLAEGAKGYEKYSEILQTKFVLLNEYTTSVKAEHDPRGPEGAYQFTDKSVPVVVIKRWDGETLEQHLGFGGTPEQALNTLSGWLDKALDKNGKVAPPKKLRPLLEGFAKGEEHLAKDKPGYAWKEFTKVVDAGADKKDFADGPPSVAEQAATKVKEILEQAEAAIGSAAEKLTEGDADSARAEYRKLLRTYSLVPALKERIQAAIKALPEE